VSILVKHSISVVPLDLDTRYSALEIAGVEFIALQPKLQLFVVYRPPYYDAEGTAYLQLLTDCLSVYTSKKRAHVIVGD